MKVNKGDEPSALEREAAVLRVVSMLLLKELGGKFFMSNEDNANDDVTEFWIDVEPDEENNGYYLVLKDGPMPDEDAML